MNKILFSILMISALPIFSQNKGDGKVNGVPKYVLRQKDFYEKRVSVSGETNFAESFYKASIEKEKINGNYLNKKTNTWTPLGPFGNDDLAGIGRVNDVIFDPKDTGTYYICVGQGGLWKSNNSGKSWTNISGDLPILRTSSLAIHPKNSDTMYVALCDYAYISHNIYANGSKRNSHYGLGVYKTVDAGKTWKPTGLSFLQTDFEGSLIQRVIINPLNTNKLIAVGQKGAFYSSDAGKNWQRTDTGLFWDLEIDPIKPNKLYATTGYLSSYNIGEAGILYSNDFGLTWNKSNIAIKKTGEVQRIEIAQSLSDPAYLYAVACDAESAGLDDGFFGFYQSTDTGKTWTAKQTKNYKYNLLGWDFDAAAGGQGKYDLALVVDKNDKNKVTVGGVNIWTTNDGGSSFLPATYWQLNYQRKSLHADVHSLRQHPDGRIFACHDGGLSATKKIIGDNPITLKDGSKISTLWTHFTSGLNITSFYRLGVNAKDISLLMAGAQDNSTSTMSGKAWYNLSGGDGMECTFGYDNILAYTSSQFGNIYSYSFDESLKEFQFNSKLQQPSGEVGEWTTPFIALEDKLYVGFGNLYTYAVFDDIPQIISSFPVMQGYSYPKPISAMAIAKKGATQIYIAKRSYPLDTVKGEVWTSKGGSTWTDISKNLPLQNYPSYLYTLSSLPKEVWITFSGFESGEKIYYSADEGANWKNISYNLPNIPVNCVAVQDDKTKNVYVGTDHGVYFLNNEKKEWELYSDGLPNVIISELEIHPKSSKLLAATFGGGVWQVDLASKDSIISVSKWNNQHVQLKLNPNPTKDIVTLNISGLQPGQFTLQVIDITGKTVLTKLLDINSQNFSEQLNILPLLSGEYFVVIEKDNRRVVGKFIKQ
ncbi:MAG: T9SS type A sorting domain-containing protein [Bacteroidia bacterium]